MNKSLLNISTQTVTILTEKQGSLSLKESEKQIETHKNDKIKYLQTLIPN